MSGSVAVTRAIAVPGLLLLLIIATALSLLIGAKSLPASVVLEAFSGTCQSADVPLPVYWQAARLALPGR